MLELGDADIEDAVPLHMTPRANVALRATVLDAQLHLRGTVGDVRSRLLLGPEVRYICLECEPLLNATPELAGRGRGLEGGHGR